MLTAKPQHEDLAYLFLSVEGEQRDPTHYPIAPAFLIILGNVVVHHVYKRQAKGTTYNCAFGRSAVPYSYYSAN